MDNLKEGDIVISRGHDCLPQGARRKVEISPAGEPYVQCREGMHFLDMTPDGFDLETSDAQQDPQTG